MRRYVRVLGAALYRSGQFDSAVERLNDAMKMGVQGMGSGLLFLAMTHHRLGHANEAKQSLAKAIERIDQVLIDEVIDGDRLTWQDKLQARILRREAEALITGAAGAK